MGCAPDAPPPRTAVAPSRPVKVAGSVAMSAGAPGLHHRLPAQMHHLQPPPHHSHAIHKNNDFYTCEFSINEAPFGARNYLTKGFIQDEISQCSGAAISTRGRFILKTDKSDNSLDRPLYLFIQGSTKQSVETAIKKIEEMIGKDSGGNHSFVRMNNNDSMKQVEKIFIGLDHLPASFDLRGKIIGRGGSNLDYIVNETGATVTLRGRGSLFIDPQLGHESREPLHLFIEHRTQDGLVAARQLAVNLIETLASEIQQVIPDSQHQQQQTNLSSGQQMMNLPPQIIGMPPLSVPPPQQQFAAVPTVQQPQNVDQPMLINNNPSDPMQGQLQHLRNQQLQHVQQIGQPQQQLIMQPPPPLARAPIVSIPPPGIHIPQHPGPMVPPPQIVQLSAPPPTAASSGNVLVVAPPPTQSVYLPPDMTASSSIGTFSFLQGGVLYHQAPPIQTQAQIGDGPHIISAPPQTTIENVNMSMNSHTQPPPHMIFTQVQVDPNNQMGSQAGDQLTHTYQQPIVSQQQQKTQYHLIGHVQGPINHDQSNIQQSQPIIQQQPRDMQSMENFSHFSINSQTSTPTSIVFTLPYHMTVTSNTSSTTTIPVSQSQIQQITGNPNQNIQIQQSEHENILKQLPRQIMHTGFLSTQQRQTRNDRNTISVQLTNNQIQTSQPPNIQPSLEHIIFTQPPNSQALINQVSHIPGNQIISTQMPPGSIAANTFLTSQNNQHIQNQLIGNQSNPVMVPQQDLSQLAANTQQMNQLPPMPPNQMPPSQLQQSQLSMNAMTSNQLAPAQLPPTHIAPGQMLSQEQLNQQQMNMQQSLQPQQIPRQFNQMSFEHSSNRQESRMQDNQNRNRMNQGGRNRKQLRNNRQNSYPWNKNDQDKSNSNWGKRDNDRNFDYDRKHDEHGNDNRQRYQQSNLENSQNDDRKSQYRSNQDKERGQYDNEKSSNSNQNSSRYQQYDKSDKSHDSSQNSWNRDKSDNQHEDSSENNRKRKYDQEGSKWSRSEDSDSIKGDNDSENNSSRRRFDKDGNWGSRSENTQKSSGSSDTSFHKSRFDPEEPNKIDGGSQQKQNTGRTSSAKTFGPNDPTKLDKETASKWSDQSGDISRTGDVIEKRLFEDDDSPKESTIKIESNNLQNQNDIEKHDQSMGSMSDRVRNQINQLNQKQVTSWGDQRLDFKGNPQYAIAGQFHTSNTTEGEKQYNPNIQQGFMNNVQVFQNTMPFLFPPPPPPPPHTQPQNNMQQHNIQFNLNQDNNNHLTTAPPNMTIVNASIPQSLSQSLTLSQNVIQTVNQNMPPNIVSSMSSHMVPNVPPSMGPNMSNNINQNVPFDMGQNIISNISQTMPPNTNQNITTNIPQTMPPGMTQNVTQNIPPNSMQVNIQNPSTMGQILPSSMAQNVTNIPPNMGQSIIQSMPPYMPQSMASNMPQAVTHHMGQNLPMLGQSITSSASQSMPPMMNQNMPPNMTSIIGTNTTNVTHTIPMSMSNNLGQNVSMMQSMVGQVPMNVGPTMVPPPPNILHGTVPQSVPNMVPPPTMPPNITNNRPQMSTQQSMSAVPPPPPPPSIHTMTTQPPYSYWMGL